MEQSTSDGVDLNELLSRLDSAGSKSFPDRHKGRAKKIPPVIDPL